jgi:hypothetical protein
MNLTEYFDKKFDFEKETPFNAFFLHYLRYAHKEDCYISDEIDAIEKWKECLYPENLKKDAYEINFGLLSFWLYENDFYIEEFPDFFERFKSSEEFSNKELYKNTRGIYGTNDKKDVTWQSRRQYIDSLVLKRRNFHSVFISEDILKLIKKVSYRNEEFNNMELNEKIACIRNTFENLGKRDGDYVDVPYEQISNGYITKEIVLKFQKEIQCFRHGEETMIMRRDAYSEDQKQFFVDMGLTILKIAYSHIENLDEVSQEVVG